MKTQSIGIIFGLLLLVGVVCASLVYRKELVVSKEGTPPEVELWKDGLFTAKGEYAIPDNSMETVGVKLTLQQGIISDIVIENLSLSDVSKEYQDHFSNGIQQKVIGKSIAGLKIETVSGASLTTRGFNAALEVIRAKAKG